MMMNEAALQACRLNDDVALSLLIEQGLSPSSEMLDTSLEAGHARIALLLIEAGAAPSAETLCHAASLGCIPLLDAILEKGVSLNSLVSYNLTPLSSAAGSAQLKMVQHMLACGAHLNSTALNAAAYYGHLDVFAYLLKLGEGHLNAESLYAAIHSGKVEIVELICQQGLVLKEEHLHYALAHSKLDIVRFALATGLELKQEDLTQTIKRRNLPLTELLLEYPIEVQELHLSTAMSGGNSKMLETLLKATGQEGDCELAQRLLSVAVMEEQREMVSYLLDKGASPCEQNIASLYNRGQVAMAHLLAKRGADINQEAESSGVTALDIATFKGDIESMEHFIDCGARVSKITFLAARASAKMSQSAQALDYLSARGFECPADVEEPFKQKQ